MSKRTRLRAGAAAAALLLAGGALTGCSANGADGETTTIRYQSSAGGVDLGELADALGYLDGLKLERVGDVQGGPEAMRAVATDQMDYGSAFDGAIAKLASTGAPITAVIASYGSEGDVSSSLLTMENSGIEDARDLIGKKIAVNTLGANAEAILDTWLEEDGLSQDEIEEVTLVPLPPLNTRRPCERARSTRPSLRRRSGRSRSRTAASSASSSTTSTWSAPTTAAAA